MRRKTDRVLWAFVVGCVAANILLSALNIYCIRRFVLVITHLEIIALEMAKSGAY